MISQSEIDELASDVIAEMVSEVPGISELGESTLESLKQFFALGYVTGHEDATKEAIVQFTK